MASASPAFRTSLVPIFLARLRALRAIVPGLNELPPPYLEELQSLFDRAMRLVEESTAFPVSSESERTPDL
jgi:hypothetical protein